MLTVAPAPDSGESTNVPLETQGAFPIITLIQLAFPILAILTGVISAVLAYHQWSRDDAVRYALLQGGVGLWLSSVRCGSCFRSYASVLRSSRSPDVTATARANVQHAHS